MRPLDNSVTGSAYTKLWKAKWIWNRDGGVQKNTYYLFRREIGLEHFQGKFHLDITADTRYRVYINDRLVGEGPPQSQPYYYYYNTHDVTGWLVRGINCIAVIVNYVGNMQDTRGGLLAELINEKGEVLAATDENWKVQKSDAWYEDTCFFRMSMYSPYQEIIDAARIPKGWKSPGFADDMWESAAILKNGTVDNVQEVLPWSRLVPRDIPYLEEAVLYPDKVLKTEECLDIMNRMRYGDLSIVLSAAGEPLQYSVIDGVENLLYQDGETVFQNSTQHRKRELDGIYSPYVILDFGRVINAYIELVLEGINGGKVDMGYAERLFSGHFNNAIEGFYADRYIMADGIQTYRTFTWKAFRYIKLQFHDCTEPVKIFEVRAAEIRYPFEDRGRFESKDEKIMSVFKICKETIKLCCNEAIMDTPWREQGQWLGDVSAVTLGGIYSCFGDTSLTGKFLRQSAKNQLPTGFLINMTNTVDYNWKNTYVDYSLWWVMALWKHYMYTGDQEWIHRYYPHVVKIIDGFSNYIVPSGMIRNMPYGVFIDWAPVDKRGECAVLNAIFYGALEYVEKMAVIKKDGYILKKVKQMRTDIFKNFKKRFYGVDTECFMDANIDGVLSSRISEHTNAAAVLWELCDEKTAHEVFTKFYEEKSIHYTEANPFFTMVVLQALDKVGRTDLALDIIRERWGKRMVDQGATSTYEEWMSNGTWRNGSFHPILRTHSHAWSAFPAEFLVKNLIGLEVVEAGFKKIRLAPRVCGMDYSVACPTPYGEIKVRCNNGKVEAEVPKDVKVLP